MNRTRFITTAVVATVTALALSSCAANEAATNPAKTSADQVLKVTGTLNAGGASSQQAAQGAWAKAFQTANPDVTVNYDPTGSGAGRQAFFGGGLDFAGSDSNLSDTELTGTFDNCAAGSKAIDLPVYISPIAILYNIDGVTDLKLDAETISKIFNGSITKWNDPAITALNSGVNLPDAAITAVHRSDDSGTTKNFTDYLGQNAPSVWTDKASDTFPIKAGEGASGTSGVVDVIKNGKNTIGYADASRAGTLGVAKIKVGDQFVGYTAAAAAAVVAESPLVSGRSANDLAIKIDRKTTDATHYPIVLVSYAIVCEAYKDAAKAKLVTAYVGYMASAEGQAVAAKATGSAPLSADLVTKVAAALATVK